MQDLYRLKELYNSKENTTELEIKIAEDSPSVFHNQAFYELPLDLISKILNRINVIDIDNVVRLMNHLSRIHGAEILPLLKYIECGSIGKKAIEALRPLSNIPLFREIIRCKDDDEDLKTLSDQIHQQMQEVSKLKDEISRQSFTPQQSDCSSFLSSQNESLLESAPTVQARASPKRYLLRSSPKRHTLDLRNYPPPDIQVLEGRPLPSPMRSTGKTNIRFLGDSSEIDIIK